MTKALSAPTDLATTLAFHQAGRAVVAYYLKQRVLRVWIDLAGGRGGTETSEPPDLERKVALRLAGGRAELRLNGSLSARALSDEIQANALISTHLAAGNALPPGYREAEPEQVRRRIADYTERLLSEPSPWRAVEALAHLLLLRRDVSGAVAERHILDAALLRGAYARLRRPRRRNGAADRARKETGGPPPPTIH